MSKSLAQWLSEQPRGALTRLMHKTKLAWSTVSRAARGQRVSFGVAVRISRATRGEVSEASLTNPDDSAARFVA